MRRDGEGVSRLWGRGSLVTTKLSAKETAGTLGISHFEAIEGERAPRHLHNLEDEIFIVEGGQVRLTVGEETETLSGSGLVFLPRGVPHSYVVESPKARFYVITTPGGFERFFSEAGYPTDLGNAAPVGDRWSVDRTQEFAHNLGLDLIWGV
ncbi:cupin domain-containing protein [Kitasatospora sp. MMS16-BH015]|uniref:cupin domain-containing protein n=1 Tax=Kitasatospora sp. MMS16-BH015 TaxID=2018025 RepID=UPI0020C4FEA5|nr:cupin domain-containing protein [Kitasatospora sp. MMS16-BH015]